MLLKGSRTPVVQDMGGFIARVNMPGWLRRWPRDHGYGPLAMVVESVLVPGRVIAMHEHRDDEIVSWVPKGVMRHKDRMGDALTVDAGHLMIMNAGISFWHSEETHREDPDLRMLQILIRPRASGLPANIQFGPLPEQQQAVWRHLVGPEGGSAPFHVRSEIDVYDIHLPAGACVVFPHAPRKHLYFYQFEGCSIVEGKTFREAEQGLFPSDGPLIVTAKTESVIVAFLMDPVSHVARTGTVGDHRSIPPPLFAPLAKFALRVKALVRR
jgi:quercetin 2,3-dioxygenase